MEHLPAELLNEIVTRCERETLFRLRGVDKRFSDLVTPIAFEHIYIGWMKKHFESFERLAQSPVGRHIRCLTINTEILPMLNGDAWLDQLRLTMISARVFRRIPDHWVEDDLDEIALWQIITTTYSKDRVKANREKFIRLAMNQQQDSPVMCRMLINAINGAVNLRHLELIDRRGIYNEGKNRKERSSGLLAKCSPWRDVLIDPDSYYGVMRDKWEVEEQRPGLENVSSAYALHYLAESLALAPTQNQSRSPSAINELSVVLGHHIPIGDVMSRTFCRLCELCREGITSVEFWNAMHTMFRTLTRVNVQMVDRPLHENRAVCRELFKGLVGASNLRHLELDDRQTGSHDFFETIANINSERPWPILEHLSVSAELMTTEQMSKLLAMCAKSLCTLEIKDVSLINPDESKAPRWDDFFENIQPTLNLQSANIRHLYYSPGIWKGLFFHKADPKSEMNKAVESFLTKRIAELPRQEKWDYNPGPLRRAE